MSRIRQPNWSDGLTDSDLHNTVRARIDLSALRHNLDVVRALCPRSRVLAMVKADAYGHGLVPVAKALSRADGLGVARFQEAWRLRQAGITQRIVVLGTLLDDPSLKACSSLRIDVVAHDKISVERIAASAAQHPLRVWLKLDSGMHRLGLSPSAFLDADRLLRSRHGITELVHMTHFASADATDPTAMDRQIACFRSCHSANDAAAASLANSAALIRRSDIQADWVRPGIMLYGVNPLVGTAVPIRSVMTLLSRVIAIREVRAGESVGYWGAWTASQTSQIATLGIGYGDGYPRHAGNGTPVWIGGHVASLVGRVSMDSLAVDVTGCKSLAVGQEAVLWGPQLASCEVANYADTSSYALFASLGQRVDREYCDPIAG